MFFTRTNGTFSHTLDPTCAGATLWKIMMSEMHVRSPITFDCAAIGATTSQVILKNLYFENNVTLIAADNNNELYLTDCS